MKEGRGKSNYSTNRRSFLKKGVLAAGAATAGAAPLSPVSGCQPQTRRKIRPSHPGDASILRFLAACRNSRTDLWQQSRVRRNPR